MQAHPEQVQGQSRGRAVQKIQGCLAVQGASRGAVHGRSRGVGGSQTKTKKKLEKTRKTLGTPPRLQQMAACMFLEMGSPPG